MSKYFCCIFVNDMKKYLLGFLLLLAFVQPLVVNMLVYNAQAHSIHALAIKSPVKKLPTTKSFGIDSVIIDLDDDEITEIETKEHSSEVYCHHNLDEAYLKQHTVLATLKSNDFQTKHSSKPLYILWNVFRI